MRPRGRAPAPSRPDDPSVTQQTGGRKRPATVSPAERWQQLFGGPPPAKSQALIAAAVAWAEQVAVHGDVAPAIQADLAILAHQLRTARLDHRAEARPNLSPANGASRATSPPSGAPRASCATRKPDVTRHIAPEAEPRVLVQSTPLLRSAPELPPHPSSPEPRRRAARTVAPLPTASSQLTVGARLVKLHGGQTHVVDVTADGMRYEGQLFTSLSAVAKHITGTHWNGLLFFGLRRRKVHGGARAHG